MIVPSAPTIVFIMLTFIIHSFFFSSLARSKNLCLFSLVFHLRLARTEKSTVVNVGNFFLAITPSSTLIRGAKPVMVPAMDQIELVNHLQGVFIISYLQIVSLTLTYLFNRITTNKKQLLKQFNYVQTNNLNQR